MPNPTGKGGWPEGKSGNPAGRPKKNRAWTRILESAGNKKLDTPDGKVARKRIIAELAMQGLAEGHVTFPDGTVFEMGPREWLELVRWVYGQVDGPPRLDMDVTTDGEKLTLPTAFIPTTNQGTEGFESE